MSSDKITDTKDLHEGHAHAHDAADLSGAKMLWVTLLNVIITAVEVIGGVLSGSLALISDALHNLSDTVSIVLSYFALKISKKSRNVNKTYGYKRAQIIAAFINASALMVISVFLIVEAIKRFGHPETINGNLMIIVAMVGLVANFISVLLLEKDSHGSMNIKSSYLHLLGDTVSSVGVVLGGLAIKFFGVLWIDPLITLMVSVYIIYEAYKITAKSVEILMQSSADMDYEALQKDMENIKEVKNIHHVHTWLADEKTIFFEAHIEVKEDLKVSELDGVYRDINHLLKEHYGVEHTTIQIEGNLCEDKELFKL